MKRMIGLDINDETIQYQNNWRSCISHIITYSFRMNNVHNRKCSNMQMAHITHTHTNNGQCTMCTYVWTKQNYLFNFTECTSDIAIQHKEIDIWRLHSITKYNNNILCISFSIWCDKLLRRPFTIHIYIRNESNLITFANVATF